MRKWYFTFQDKSGGQFTPNTGVGPPFEMATVRAKTPLGAAKSAKKLYPKLNHPLSIPYEGITAILVTPASGDGFDFGLFNAQTMKPM